MFFKKNTYTVLFSVHGNSCVSLFKCFFLGNSVQMFYIQCIDCTTDQARLRKDCKRPKANYLQMHIKYMCVNRLHQPIRSLN